MDPVARSRQMNDFLENHVPNLTEHSDKRLFEVILDLKKRQKILGDKDNVPKARMPKTAAEVLANALTDRSSVDRQAGCYELSILFIALARILELPVAAYERVEPSGTGQIGHVVAGVKSQQGLRYFDLQNETTQVQGRMRELTNFQLIAHHYNHLAVSRYLNKDFEGALVSIDDALKLYPESASFLNNRATILASVGDYHLALAEVLAAVQLEPRVPLFRYQAGRLLLLNGQIDDAERMLSSALLLKGNYALARRDRGWVYLLLGQVDRAQNDLESALRADSENVDNYLYLILFYLVRDQRAKADATFESAKKKLSSGPHLVAMKKLLREPALGGDDDTQRWRMIVENVKKREVAVP